MARSMSCCSRRARMRSIKARHSSGVGMVRKGLKMKQTLPPKSNCLARSSHTSWDSSEMMIVRPGLTGSPARVPPALRRESMMDRRVVLPSFPWLVKSVVLPGAMNPCHSQSVFTGGDAVRSLSQISLGRTTSLMEVCLRVEFVQGGLWGGCNATQSRALLLAQLPPRVQHRSLPP